MKEMRKREKVTRDERGGESETKRREEDQSVREGFK